MNDDRRPPEAGEWAAFGQQLQEEAQRPPRLSSEAAARSVLARLETPPRRRLARGSWLAAAALVAALGVSWWVTPESGIGPQQHPLEATTPVVPLEEGVVLLWLDAGIPLYMTVTPPRADEGGQGDSS